LVEEETLYDISSRLIVNPASSAIKRALINPMIGQLREAVQQRDAENN
jgi:ATP phosphoribosyltransferase